MKKLFMVILILVTAVSYAQTQQTITPGGLQPITWSSVGCYYKGAAYIFYSGLGTNRNNIIYNKVYIDDSDMLNFVPDSTRTLGAMYEFPFKFSANSVMPTACVFNGKLYFFYAKPTTNQIMSTSTDGSTWTDPQSVSDYKAKGISMSASVLDGNLYLTFQDKDKNVTMICTGNVLSWRPIGQIISASDMSNNNASISTCTFATSNNSSHILVAVNYNNAWIYTTWYDEKNGYHKSQKVIVSTNGKSVNLVQGSLNYLNMTNANASVQLLYRGTNDMLWVKQYYPDDNNWDNSINTGYLTKMIYSPGVFTLLRSVNKNKLVKRICAVEAGYNESHIECLNACIFNSDIIKNTGIAVNKCENIPSLWSLVGVIEGPPPFVLNGRNLDELLDNQLQPSEFTYETSGSQEVINSSEWTVSTSVSVSVPFADIFSAGVDLTTAVNGSVSTSYEQNYSELHSVLPVDSAYGYYYFLKPTITRYKYQRFDYNMDTTKQYEYVFTVTDANLTPVPFVLKDFNPFDITSYINKAPAPTYSILYQKGVTWTEGNPVNFTFSTSKSTEKTNGTSVEVSANIGAEDFFEISSGYSIEINETHKTTFGKSVGFTLNNPNPRSGHPEDVKSYSANMYWLQSTSKNDYWIPKNLYGHDFSDQHPWLITWSVDSSIVYNGITGIKDKSKLPTEFSLSQNYPNPFNPTTTIKYSIPIDLSSSQNGEGSTKLVTLKVYNMVGQEVKTLVNEEKSPGNYSVRLNASDLASGIYFYRLRAGSFISTRKLILLK